MPPAAGLSFLFGIHPSFLCKADRKSGVLPISVWNVDPFSDIHHKKAQFPFSVIKKTEF